jgi:hypothetical protein
MNKRQPITLGEVIEHLQEIQSKYGSDLVVKVGGKDIETITAVIWSPEEQFANGGDLRDMVKLEGVASEIESIY